MSSFTVIVINNLFHNWHLISLKMMGSFTFLSTAAGFRAGQWQKWQKKLGHSKLVTKAWRPQKKCHIAFDELSRQASNQPKQKNLNCSYEKKTRSKKKEGSMKSFLCVTLFFLDNSKEKIFTFSPKNVRQLNHKHHFFTCFVNFVLNSPVTIIN